MEPNNQSNQGGLNVSNANETLNVNPQVQQVVNSQVVAPVETLQSVGQVPTNSQTSAPNNALAINNNGKSKANLVINAQKKKVRNIFIIVIFLAIVIIGFSYMKSKGGVSGLLSNQPKERENINIDTGYPWADYYGNYIQELFKTVNVFEVAFVDFNSDTVPEMAVKFKDLSDNTAVKIYQINNKEVSETKNYYNSQFKLIYSKSDNAVNWYIFIALDQNASSSRERYGSYTKISRILDGTAKNSDVKVTNEKEKASYGLNYNASDYKVVFYEVKEPTFEDDFKTMVKRYKDYEKEFDAEKEKLLSSSSSGNNQEGPSQSEEPVVPNEPEEKTGITVSGVTAKFGTYKATIEVTELGEKVKKEKILILKDGVFTYDNEDVSYTAYSSFITTETGVSLKVDKENTLLYGPSGIKFTLEEEENDER